MAIKLVERKIIVFSNIKKLSLIAVAATLTACGGGGDSAGVATPATAATTATSFPVQSALVYAYTNGLQQTLSVTGTASGGGTSYPISGTLTFTQGKTTNTTFNGVSALQYITTITGSVVVNGQNQSLNGNGTGYLDTRYAPIGSVAEGMICVPTTASAYPATAVAGQTGTIASFACYTDSTKTVPLGSEKISYAASAGSVSNTLDINVSDSFYDTANQLFSSTSTVYTINSAGVPSISKITVTEIFENATIDLSAQ